MGLFHPGTLIGIAHVPSILLVPEADVPLPPAHLIILPLKLFPTCSSHWLYVTLSYSTQQYFPLVYISSLLSLPS